MANGLGIELEEGGLVALIGVLLLPGALWIAKAKDGKSMAGRAALVAGLVGTALMIEAAMEQTAGEIKDVLS
jgi:uncharacterized membrane protein